MVSMVGIDVRRLLRRRLRLCDLARRSIVPALATLVAVPAQGFAADQAPSGPEAVAVQVIAATLGIAHSGARVVSSEARDFPDGSLGCPQPGMAYAQVLTPGHRVLVEADGRRFDVRVAGDHGLVCYLRRPGPASSAIPARESGEGARNDLARRLGTSAETISITGLRRLRPGESLDGCGEVCAKDAGAASCGVGIRLRFGARDFDYIALPAGVRPCPDIAPE